MSDFLIFISMVTGTASFIALFRPFPRIGLPTRKRAAVVWVASWVLLGIGGVLAPEPTPEELAARADAERVSEEEEARREAEETPEQQLRSEIISELGRSNRDVNRLRGLTYENSIVRVTWAINDNLTQGMLRTNARSDASDILRLIAESGLPYQTVEIQGTFPLVDRLGNSEESVVTQAAYTRATLDRVNWDNFLYDNVFLIAEGSMIHQDFR